MSKKEGLLTIDHGHIVGARKWCKSIFTEKQNMVQKVVSLAPNVLWKYVAPQHVLQH